MEQIWWIRFPTAINVRNSFPVCFSNGHFVLQGFARARSSDFFSLTEGIPVWERIPFKGVGLLDHAEKLVPPRRWQTHRAGVLPTPPANPCPGLLMRQIIARSPLSAVNRVNRCACSSKWLPASPSRGFAPRTHSLAPSGGFAPQPSCTVLSLFRAQTRKESRQHDFGY